MKDQMSLHQQVAQPPSTNYCRYDQRKNQDRRLQEFPFKVVRRNAQHQQ